MLDMLNMNIKIENKDVLETVANKTIITTSVL